MYKPERKKHQRQASKPKVEDQSAYLNITPITHNLSIPQAADSKPLNKTITINLSKEMSKKTPVLKHAQIHQNIKQEALEPMNISKCIDITSLAQKDKSTS